MALGSVQGRQLPPTNTAPLKQLAHAVVPDTQAKHVEFVHWIATPPTMEYPSYAMVQITLFDVPLTHVEQPGSHGTILPLTLAQLTPPPTD
jgi:hypothetical protein